MGTPGISTANFAEVSAADEVIVNQTADGLKKTGRMKMAKLAQQLLADGPIADQFDIAAGHYDVSVALVADLAGADNGTVARVVGEAVSASNGIYKMVAGVPVRLGPLPGSDLTGVNSRLDAIEAGKADNATVTALSAAMAAKASDADLRALTNACLNAITAEVANRKRAQMAMPLHADTASRPALASTHFVTSLVGGDPVLLPSIDPAIVTEDEAGLVVEIEGVGLVAAREIYPVEQSHTYLPEFAVRRRQDSPDPANDAIRLGIAWYDRSNSMIGQTVLYDETGVLASGGRIARATKRVARVGGGGIVAAPAGACGGRMFVQTFGSPLTRTLVEVIRWSDVTHQGAWSPDLAAVEARLTAQESGGFGARLDVVEAELAAPKGMRMATLGHLMTSPTVIPVSAETVEVLGRVDPGDPGAACWRRCAGPVRPGVVQRVVDNSYWQLTGTLLNGSMLPDIADLMRAAYNAGAMVQVRRGETAYLVCDAAAGDDLLDMCKWAAGSIQAQAGSTWAVQLLGLHRPVGYLSLQDGQRLNLCGPAEADRLDLASITYTSLGSQLYQAVVAVTQPLPAWVDLGWPIGGQNVHGDELLQPLNGANALNGGHVVEAIAGDRMSFSITVRCHGVAPTNVSAWDNSVGAALAIDANKVVVPRCAVIADTAGWDGDLIEGFLNTTEGGQAVLLNIGLNIEGLASNEHDVLFTRKNGSLIVVDGCVIVGSAPNGKCMRTAGGEIFGFRSCFGPGKHGLDCYMGQNTGACFFSRCSMGGGRGHTVVASTAHRVVFSQCILAGGANLLRTTFESASIDFASGRMSHGGIALRPARGVISVDVNVTVRLCTTILPSTGVDGYLDGNPALVGNTTAMPPSGVFLGGTGGWRPTVGTKLIDKNWQPLARVPVIITFGAAIPPGRHSDIAVVYPGVVFSDLIFLSKSNAQPNQTIDQHAFVSGAGAVTHRCKNYGLPTDPSILPAAATWFYTAVHTT